MQSNKADNGGLKGWPTIIVSSTIMVTIMTLAVQNKMPMLKGHAGQWLPFVFTIVGVLLYIMASAKTRRERFDRKFLPDYFYRGAQAVVYLYIILSFLASGDNTGTVSTFESWSPNTIGLFVGLFILHVEKAMEGFGQRFEESLAAIFPRALTSKTSREKQLERLRSETRFQEIKTQAEGMVSQFRNDKIAAAFQIRLREVEATLRSKDDDGIKDEVSQLAWEFESIKKAMREEELTIDEILRRDSE
ncbi:MAG: hypothetical protein GY835_07525 [bacterium]|nr:hypothetical protein [bacterium]